jgi:hypothetical protein
LDGWLDWLVSGVAALSLLQPAAMNANASSGTEMIFIGFIGLSF